MKSVAIWSLFLGLNISAANAAALAWSDLQVGQTSPLTETLALSDELDPNLARDVRAGTPIRIEAIEGLEMIGVVWIQGSFAPCAEPSHTSEMTLAIPSGLGEDAAVGAKLEADCHLEFFVELKDLDGESLFSAP